jgi:transcriptional regulator of arginine metabolism
MNTQRRRTKILNLIQKGPVLSQTQLSQRLKGEGFRVAQATLSRDLRALNLVRTHPGNASPVARSLDTIGWKEIVGTVAGDDTILIVTANAATARLIKQRLLALGD